MSDLLRRMLHLGIGIAAVTKEKAEAFVQDLVERGELTKDEAATTVQELVAKGEAARAELEATVSRLVDQALQRLDVPSRRDLEKLEQRIARLEAGAGGPQG